MSAFFDTNILVYAFLDVEKRDAALTVISGGGTISAQVLNEFTNVARRRRREWPEIAEAIGVIRDRFPDISPLTAETHAVALALAQDHGFSFYDALIAAAAVGAGCDTLYSEDMQHGRVIDGLTIRNPFTEPARA